MEKESRDRKGKRAIVIYVELHNVTINLFQVGTTGELRKKMEDYYNIIIILLERERGEEWGVEWGKRGAGGWVGTG